MSQSGYRTKYRYEADIRLPFKVRRKFDALEFPAKLEQYLLAEAAGVVASILREEEEAGHAIIHGENFWYFPDRSLDITRPLLVAHVDTVCSPFPPSELHRRGGRIRNPNGILGADDRAGVFAVLELRRRTGVGVLLCDEEEHGAHGARAAARTIGDLIKLHPYMVELDRHGYREVVYYRQECDTFCEHMESYGFEEERGSFSDISVLSRELDVPGANVSIGFNSQHTKWEYLDLFSLWDTIARVQRLIEENKHVIITPCAPNFPVRGYVPPSQYQRGEYTNWREKEEIVDADVVDEVEAPPKMTPEEHDHMVAMELEARDAERLSYIEKRTAEWEEEMLVDNSILFDDIKKQKHLC